MWGQVERARNVGRPDRDEAEGEDAAPIPVDDGLGSHHIENRPKAMERPAESAFVKLTVKQLPSAKKMFEKALAKREAETKASLHELEYFAYDFRVCACECHFSQQRPHEKCNL